MLDEQKELRDLLFKSFSEVKTRNKSYSIRAFSKRLKINSSSLSEILREKRRIGRKLAIRILDSLMVKPEKKEHILRIYDNKDPNKAKTVPFQKKVILQNDLFQAISNWHHYAILALVDTTDFKSNIKWIAMRLDLPIDKVSDSIDRLIRLEMLWIDSKNNLCKPENEYISTDDKEINLSIQNNHIEGLELARKSLEKNTIHERDFLSTTIATSPKNIKAAKKHIRKMMEELSHILSSDDKSEVYRFQTQLIPLTRLNQKIK